MSTIGIYLIHNPSTEEVYVGSGDLGVRKQRHFKDLENGRSGAVSENQKPLRHPNRKLQAAYNRDPNFEFLGLPMEDREDAFDCEQTVIDKFKGNPKFLNLSMDARAGVYEMTEETRRKMSDSQKRHYENNPERRLKISEQLSNRVITDETRERLSQSQRGKVVSEETREKLRQATLGQQVSDETRQKISALHLGVPKTDEHKAKIGIKSKAAWEDPAYKQRMAEANGIKVQVNGQICTTIKQAAAVAGIPYRQMRSRLSKGGDENISYV